VRYSVPWLSSVAEDLDGEGLGRYAIEYDSLFVESSDALSAKVFIDYRVNNGATQVLELPVYKSGDAMNAQVNDLQVYLLPKSLVASGGDQYQVYSAQRFDTVTGGVSFSFDQVPAGDYYLEASSDNDGDGRLFDAGEAVGAYRFSNSDSFLRVDADIESANFSMTYSNIDQLNDYASLDTLYTPRISDLP